jgi:hypothetical protein
VHDAILMEAAGVPAVAVCTEPFRTNVSGAAATLGLPQARVLFLPHPFGTLPPAAIAELARARHADVLAMLTEP